MVTVQPSRRALSPATSAGLVLALVVPLLPFVLSPFVHGNEQSLRRVLWGVAEHWTNLAALLAVVVFWERQSLASIGLRRLQWWTLPLGLIAGVVITVVAGILVNVLKLPPDQKFAAYIQSLPFATRVLLVVTAGVFEETLFRGYAIERLTAILGNKWLAAIITVTLFTLGHVPAVGWAHLMPVALVSVFVTLLYLWRRDLVVNMVAHATIDAIGVLIAPLLGASPTS